MGSLTNWGGCKSTIGVGMNADGRMEIFALGAGGVISHTWQTAVSSGPWSGWANLGSAGGGFTWGPLVISAYSGQADLEVIAKNSNNQGWWNIQESPGGSWRGWQPT